MSGDAFAPPAGTKTKYAGKGNLKGPRTKHSRMGGQASFVAAAAGSFAGTLTTVDQPADWPATVDLPGLRVGDLLVAAFTPINPTALLAGSGWAGYAEYPYDIIDLRPLVGIGQVTAVPLPEGLLRLGVLEGSAGGEVAWALAAWRNAQVVQVVAGACGGGGGGGGGGSWDDLCGHRR